MFIAKIRNMKALVIGATGATGKDLVTQLLSDPDFKEVDVFVRKVAPLGDPMEVTVRGYELSIRKEEAAVIEVEE